MYIYFYRELEVRLKGVKINEMIKDEIVWKALIFSFEQDFASVKSKYDRLVEMEYIVNRRIEKVGVKLLRVYETNILSDSENPDSSYTASIEESKTSEDGDVTESVHSCSSSKKPKIKRAKSGNNEKLAKQSSIAKK